jgi:hypothetical protein
VKRSFTAPALALFLLVSGGAAAGAQSPAAGRTDSVPPASWLEIGALVRVTQSLAPPPERIGTLLRADSLITIRRFDGGGLFSVPAAEVRRLEVRGAPTVVRRHPHRGAKIGLMVGAIPSVAAVVLGSIVDGSSGGCADASFCVSMTGVAVVGGLLFTGITTGIGALVDHGHHGSGRAEPTWSIVRLPVRLVARDTVRAAAVPRPET